METECAGQRRVLVVVRNGASLSRLHDCLEVARRDNRIGWFWTVDPGSRFAAGLDAELQRRQVPLIPWEDALRQRYDLVIAAHAGPALHQVDGPTIVVPHGVGANRLVPHRTGDLCSPVGFSRSELMVGDVVVPDHIGISDECLLGQLTECCPEALDRAFVMGDPAWDRIVGGLPQRDELRAELGVRPGQRVVVVSTTWNGGSLWGQQDHLIERLLAQLPADEYMVLLVMHPNIIAQHSPYHLDGLLADARAAGLRCVQPFSDWHVAPIVADLAVGDHGSVSVYLAALGVPIFLAGDGSEELAPKSTTAQFVARAPVLGPDSDLRALLDATVSPDESVVHAARAPLARHQGRALDLLQRKVYQVLGLSADHRPKFERFAAGISAMRACTACHVVAEVSDDGTTVVVERFPAAVARFRTDGREHVLVVKDTELDSQTRDVADVVVSSSSGKLSEARKSVDNLLAELYCLLAGAAVEDGLVLRQRHGPAWRVKVRGDHPDATALAAGAVHAWLTAHPRHSGNFRFTLVVADSTLKVSGRGIRWKQAVPLISQALAAQERHLARLVPRQRVNRVSSRPGAAPARGRSDQDFHPPRPSGAC